ncbi:hypothetical protein SAMN02745166_05132 [Prosthecobacter debontii]|uniref:Uncharacterized protein n=1 Tax=Prosthecobacter debontii TaxID=48467 RepID=A0A1T4Z6Y5_9BACT|nr:hypothetical protein [Prosthecobacter debontii]SKB09335.1 hypothetical protein SAMN02745166_05132 [Prosthecobacter debontii]
MNTPHTITLIVVLLAQCLVAQTPSREQSLAGINREAVLKEQIEKFSTAAEHELIAVASSPSAQRDSRIAAAVLLLKMHKTQQSSDAAIAVMSLQMPAGLNDWEGASDWRLSYPVAAEASLRFDLMPQIIERTLNGTLPESVVGFVLLRYQTDNHAPDEHLAALLKTNLTLERRQRGKRLVAILKGETPKETPSNEALEKPASTPVVVVQPSSPKKPDGATPTTQAPSEEPTSSTPWSIIVVLIVAATGLLWLLLKRRS